MNLLISAPVGGRPQARAILRGNDLYPSIEGEIRFYDAPGGSVVEAEVTGLPEYRPAPPGGQPRGPFGFHIHMNSQCGSGAQPTPFEMAGGHYNPDFQPHGNHAGDLPVLWAPDGRAYMAVFTDRFTPRQVVGRTVMVHESPDDYRTQPAGNSGARIACGVIEKS